MNFAGRQMRHVHFLGFDHHTVLTNNDPIGIRIPHYYWSLDSRLKYFDRRIFSFQSSIFVFVFSTKIHVPENLF